MAKPRIGVFEVRRAALKREFAALFPEHSALFHTYWTKPGCGDCWRTLLAAIARDQERARSFFGDVDLDLGAPPPKRSNQLAAATTIVWNCRVDELQGRVDVLSQENAGAKTFTLARWRDQVTCIVSVVDVPSPNHRHVIVECSIEELSDRLAAVRHDGPTQVAASRHEDRIVAIVTCL